MSGEIPQIYWYLFWVGVLAFVIVFSLAMMTLIARRNMKALELLKLYAEKGMNPPPGLTELMATNPRRCDGGDQDKPSASSRGR